MAKKSTAASAAAATQPPALTGQAAGDVCQPLADERELFEEWAADRWESEEIAMRHKDAYWPVSLNAAWNAWQARASLAQQAGAHAEQLCPACQGSGEGLMMEGAGPDMYEVPCNCPHCNGSGGLLDAYNGVVALLTAEHEKYMQCCGKVFAASLAAPSPSAEKERDAKRLDKFIDWYLREGRRMEIDPFGHIRRTERAHILHWLDGGSNDDPENDVARSQSKTQEAK